MTMKYFLILLFPLLTIPLIGQRVTVSKDFSVRSDVGYDILGKVGNNILLFRDRGEDKQFEVFDKTLKHLYTQNISLKNKNVNIYAIVPQDTTVNIVYGYRDKRKYYLMVNKYNETGSLIDTSSIFNGIEDFRNDFFQYQVSEDKSKLLLFSSRKGSLLFTYVIDNNTMELLWSKETLVLDYNIRKDFRKIIVTNIGEVNVLFEKNNNRFNREDHNLFLLGLDAGDGAYENYFLFDDKMTVDITFEYDDKNKRIVLAGLTSEDSEYDANGFFYYTAPIDSLRDFTTLEDHIFDLSFLEELYGEKLSKKKSLNDFITRDIILREDGGFLLVTEMHKEYFRRSAFNGTSRLNNGYAGGRGWLDIYDEDIIIFSINPDGTEHWKQIFYKKQFSQDDDGIFSSFFLFKTPSRLRLIYNDEIKRNNTVSEYVIDPLGNFERNSILSTDYQNLKLRFQEAIQVSSNTLIVPSERNYKLNLVKITY